MGDGGIERGLRVHVGMCFRYNIRIENLIGEQLQLRERHWKICSVAGTLETVRGRGVIGQVMWGREGLTVIMLSL